MQMLNKVIIIEDDNKVQCDSVEEVVKTLIDEKYYELDEKEKLEILIHNINEILYKQFLSVDDTIKDYEELVKDETIDSEEKQKYLESMLKVIEIRSKKEDIGSIKKFIETIKKLISKNDKKEKICH